MTLLVFFIFLSIGMSFICSILEAVILSVTPSYLGALEQSDPKLFKKIKYLKDDIDRPLASILTFNTISHTVGAAGAGAQAQLIFGSDSLAIFSAALTFGILFFSEIIPKSIGARSWKALLPITSTILKPMIFISYPIVWAANLVSKFFKGKSDGISREEIIVMSEMGLNDGAIKSSEHDALKGLIEFEKVQAVEIMTDKSNTEFVRVDDNIEKAYLKIQSHPYSRILVFDKDDNVKGFILRTQLLSAHINKNAKSVTDIIVPILTSDNQISFRRQRRLGE